MKIHGYDAKITCKRVKFPTELHYQWHFGIADRRCCLPFLAVEGGRGGIKPALVTRDFFLYGCRYLTCTVRPVRERVALLERGKSLFVPSGHLAEGRAIGGRSMLGDIGSRRDTQNSEGRKDTDGAAQAEKTDRWALN